MSSNGIQKGRQLSNTFSAIIEFSIFQINWNFCAQKKQNVIARAECLAGPIQRSARWVIPCFHRKKYYNPTSPRDSFRRKNFRCAICLLVRGIKSKATISPQNTPTVCDVVRLPIENLFTIMCKDSCVQGRFNESSPLSPSLVKSRWLEKKVWTVLQWGNSHQTFILWKERNPKGNK